MNARKETCFELGQRVQMDEFVLTFTVYSNTNTNNDLINMQK